jgi:hypothetical protein
MLYQLTGIDLITVPSLKTRTVRTLLSEIGLDLRKWPNTKTFCSRRTRSVAAAMP